MLRNRRRALPLLKIDRSSSVPIDWQIEEVKRGDKVAAAFGKAFLAPDGCEPKIRLARVPRAGLAEGIRRSGEAIAR